MTYTQNKTATSTFPEAIHTLPALKDCWPALAKVAWGAAKRAGLDDATADDAAQETYLQLLKRVTAKRPIPERAGTSVPAYVAGVARNMALKLRATNRRAPQWDRWCFFGCERKEDFNPHAQIEREEERAALYASLEALPPKQKSAIEAWLHATDNQTNTAAALGRNRSTFAHAKRLGMKKLDAMLERIFGSADGTWREAPLTVRF